MFRSSKLFVVALVTLVFVMAAFAFAASNTVPASYAGEGSSVTSGYTVTNVRYNLNGTTASNIDSVEFDLSAPATVVRIRLTAAGSFYTCSNAATHWTCATTAPQATVATASELTVVATQ
jgi:hypothetical protein